MLTRFVRQVGEGEQGLDYTKVLDKVVKPNNPQDLIKFLKATKKARTIKGVRPEEVKVRFAEKDYSIEAAERLLANALLNPSSLKELTELRKLKPESERAAIIVSKLGGYIFTDRD